MPTIFGFDAATVLAFDRAYVLSKDPRIQALFAGMLGFPGNQMPAGTRYSTALELENSGLTVDRAIDAWGWDPYLTIVDRNALGANLSLNPADYPPFAVPPPLPVEATGYVGTQEAPGKFVLTPKASADLAAGKITAGELWEENGHTYVLVDTPFLIGRQTYWNLLA